MKTSLLIASLVAALASPAFAQIPSAASIPKDSSQIRDDNHDFRPDRVDQRSSTRDMNSNEARDARHKVIKESRERRKQEKEYRDNGYQQPPGAASTMTPTN